MPKPSAAYPTSGPCRPGSYCVSRGDLFLKLSDGMKANENLDNVQGFQNHLAFFVFALFLNPQ